MSKTQKVRVPVGGHAVDLEDGRMLEPGADAVSADMDSDHNKALAEAGHLIVIPPKSSKGD